MCLRGWVMRAARAGCKPSICWAERPGCSFITVSVRGGSSATLPVAVAVQIKFLTPGLSCHYFCTATSLFSQLIQTIEMVKTYGCWQQSSQLGLVLVWSFLFLLFFPLRTTSLILLFSNKIEF